MRLTMPQDVSRVLASKNKLSGTKIVALSDIHSVADNLQDKAFDDTLKKSLSIRGMLNPILICTDKDFKQTDIKRFERRPVPEEITQTYRCLIGNNRYKYAVENGYTHIECHVVTTFDEVKKAHLLTQIEPRKM